MLFSKVTNQMGSRTVRCAACERTIMHSEETCHCGTENLLRHIEINDLEKMSEENYDDKIIQNLEAKGIETVTILIEIREILKRRKEAGFEKKSQFINNFLEAKGINSDEGVTKLREKLEEKKENSSRDEPQKKMTMDQFGTAKAVFGFFIAVGWIIAVVGIALFFIMLLTVGFDKLAALSCCLIFVSGIFTVAGGQMGMTQIATAENTAAILAVLTQNSKQNVSISGFD
jgi:hypothetical protein